MRKFASAAFQPLLGEFFFDSHPTKRIAIVAWWKCPDCVPVIGKQNDGYDLKGMVAFDPLDGLMKAFAAKVGGEDWSAVICDAGEKVGTARDVVATIGGHESY